MTNDVKTDFLMIGTCQQLEETSIESITIGDTVIKPLETVWNLGSLFDAHMRINVHMYARYEARLFADYTRTPYDRNDEKIPCCATQKDTDPCLCIFAP